jgi:hypothetical protein
MICHENLLFSLNRNSVDSGCSIIYRSCALQRRSGSLNLPEVKMRRGQKFAFLRKHLVYVKDRQGSITLGGSILRDKFGYTQGHDNFMRMNKTKDCDWI